MTCGPMPLWSCICLSKHPFHRSVQPPAPAPAPATGHKDGGKRQTWKAQFPAVRWPPTCLERHSHHKQHSIPWPVAAGHGDKSRARHVLACGLISLLGSGRGTSLVLNCVFPDYRVLGVGKIKPCGSNGYYSGHQLLAFAHSQHSLPSTKRLPGSSSSPPQEWCCANRALLLASGTVEK